MRIFAHRGNGFGAPENSLKALRRVVRAPLDGVELDVRLTGDHVPVLLHDPIFRFRGRRVKIADVLYREPGFPLPTLYEACTILLPTHAIIVEVKPGLSTLTPIASVLEIFKDLSHKLWVSSFDPEILFEFRKNLPWLRRTLLVAPRLDQAFLLKLALDLEIEGVHLELKQLKRFPVGEWKRRGFKVRAYTVNTVSAARIALDLGADDLMSDYPIKLFRFLKRRE